MKHFKRWLSCLLVICMTMSMLPLSVFAESTVIASGSCGDNLTWVLNNEGTLTISGTGEMYNYAYYASTPSWYEYSSLINSVLIEEGVTSIGNQAFRGYSSIKSITISNSVVSIGDNTFEYCTGITAISIPVGVITIGDKAFSGCENLVSVFIAESVTTIAFEAFAGCTNMIEVVIPDSVTYIDTCAFRDCNSIKRVTIPDSVVSTGEIIFYRCLGLNHVSISNNLTNIGRWMFAGCSNLKSVTIPASITIIYQHAFEACSNLSDIYYAGSEEQWKKICIEDDNYYLTNATIHYNSTGPNVVNENSSVRYFREWDAENQIAYFNDDTFFGCQVTDETDLSFLENVDSLVGKYVLVESLPREDGMIAPDTLLSIYAVETKTGTVSAADDDSQTITIDGVMLDANMPDGYLEYFKLSEYIDDLVVYHTYDGAIVGIDRLKTTEGKLIYWDKEANKIEFDNCEDICRLSEAADADTIELLGDTGYFEYDVSYVVDSNSLVYHIERLPAIDITNGNILITYFDRRNLSIQCDEEMECICVLYYDGIPQDDWSKPVFTISNEDVLTVAACEKTDNGYCLTIKGINPGTATIIVTDADTGTYVDFDIEVREEGVVTYSYLFDEVPSFYPNVICDKDTQTNFYNCNGLYVNGFQGGSTFDGNYKFNFTVYNSTNMYGSVDVYDEHGNWYSSERIDKHTSITGLLDTAESAYFLLYDGLSQDLLSYTAHSYSTSMKIEITVPAGGYFTISNNYLESYGAYLYNMVDFMMISVDMLLDKAFSSADVKEVQKQTVEQILQTPEANKIFLAGFKNAAQSMISDIAKQGYSDAIESMTLNAFGLFEEMDFNFMDAVKIACGLGENQVEDLFVKCTPPIIGETLKSMYKINKYLDRIYQVKDVFVSVDQPYIRIYTTEAIGGLTISGVTVEPDEEVLPDNAVLQVFRIANRDALIISDKGLVADQYDLYNICFTANNVEVQPTGNVTVKIPVPSHYNSDKCIVLHQQTDGSWKVVESQIEDGFIVFEVDHFCQFAIVDTTVHGDTDGSGKVNMRDIALIQQYLNGKDVSIDLTVADVDASGKINMRDAALIQQYLNGKDVELT